MNRIGDTPLSPSTRTTSPIDTMASGSSVRIVASATSSNMIAFPVMLLSTTSKRSSPSTTVSPNIVTVNVCTVSPGANDSVPLVAA